MEQKFIIHIEPQRYTTLQTHEMFLDLFLVLWTRQQTPDDRRALENVLSKNGVKFTIEQATV